MHSSDCLWLQFFNYYFFKGLCSIFPLLLPSWVPGMEAKERGPLGGGNIMSLDGFSQPVDMSLSEFFYHCIWNSSFNTFFMSLVPISSVLCRCSRACVACWNVTLTGPRSGKTHLLHRFALNEWFSGNQRPMFCTKDSGIARGQALRVVTNKCVAWSCLSIKSGVFGQRMQHFAMILWETEVTNVRVLKFQVSVR